MTPVLSTHLFVRHRLTTVWLERAWDAGFAQVEIFCARQHLDYRDRAQINELGHWFRDSELKLHSVHAPMYNDEAGRRSGPQAVIDITERTKARRIAMVDEIKRAIEIADVIPFKYVIQHIGVQGAEYDEWRLESAFSSLEELKVFAAQREVEVLLENTPNELSTAERLQRFLSETHLDLNYCFDIGHAHLEPTGVAEEFALMKDGIRSLHLHDNDGTKDAHLIPGKGSIDWKAAMKLLRSLADAPLLLELSDEQDMPHPIEEARRAADYLSEIKTDEQ
jgi:sugar phosphate isomerase/epimerase